MDASGKPLSLKQLIVLVQQMNKQMPPHSSNIVKDVKNKSMAELEGILDSADYIISVATIQAQNEAAYSCYAQINVFA